MSQDESSELFKLTRADKWDHFTQLLNGIARSARLPADEESIKPFVFDHLMKLGKGLDRATDEAALGEFSAFLPPRLVLACRNGSLIPFFGSGVSMASGIPSWSQLLEALGIPSDYVSDPHVEHDPLTQAELIAHGVGTDALQRELRDRVKVVDRPTLAHYLLASLQLPVYLTTNYDTLFEKAWADLGFVPPLVIKNDADVAQWALNDAKALPISGRTVLIKIHGDVAALNEQLILTRTDYRRHYRINTDLFEVVKKVLRSGRVLFVGFSHRDPEISRLVEDVVHRYESDRRGNVNVPAPMFYSVQFDMRQRTPEVFAARGIVALRPPPILEPVTPSQLRSISVARVLGELAAAADYNTHAKLDLSEGVSSAIHKLSGGLASAMAILRECADRLMFILNDEARIKEVLQAALAQLGQYGGQGLYVTHPNGDILTLAVPEGLDASARNMKKSFADRSYFQQAKTFRHDFVSDVFPSVYNGHGTVALCAPLGNEQKFSGLLFAAVQPGAWTLPLELRESCADGIEFLLVDSNGVAVIPSLREVAPAAASAFPPGEDPGANVGFPFARLHGLSRRDSHIAHIVQNIVPVGWDDDVHDIAPDLRLFSMVADVPNSRWKLALSSYVAPSIAG
jgi:hypothetical protein